MHTISQDLPRGRTRRTYSASFRAELVAQCRQVGVSCSAVAISNGMNPNVLRRWIKEAQGGGAAHAVFAAQLRYRRAGVGLFQNRDDLAVCKS